jgi:WD40 repeat protein
VFNLIDGKRVVVWQAGITEAVGDSASGISCVAFSPDGKWLVSAGFGIQIWSTSNFQRYAVLGGHTSLVLEISFSPENLMASACVDHTIQIWDLSDKNRINTTVRRFGDNQIYDVKICPNGEIAVHDIRSPNLAMWDPVADRVRYIEEVGRGIAVSPEGILASVSGGKIRLTDLVTGEQVENPLARTVYEMAYSSKNDLLALGTLAGEFELWKARSGNRILHVKTGQGRIDPIAFSSDGKQVATGHLENGRVTLWDAEQGEKLRELDVGFGCGELGLDFSQDGRLLAVGRAFLGIQIWDLTVEKGTPDVLPVATMAVKFAPSGKSLFSGAKGDAMLHVWDLETHRQCALPGVERIRDIDVSPDGNTVVVGGRGGTVRLLRAIDDNSLRRR